MSRTILVTAVGSFSAAAVVGNYKKEGFRVIGCDIYPAEWIVASGEVDRFYQAPPRWIRRGFRHFWRGYAGRNRWIMWCR